MGQVYVNFSPSVAGLLASAAAARYGRAMAALIWIGAVLSVLGLAGLLWCIRKAAWIKGAELDAETVQGELNRLIFVHMAAIGGAFLGMGLLVVGLLLR